MARKRMLDPNIWDSADFANLSVLSKLIFIGMISNADDEGRGRANTSYLKSKIFPYDMQMHISDIEKSLDEIAAHVSVLFYTYRSCDYYSLVHWKKWQRVDKPQPSRIAAFDESACKIVRSDPNKAVPKFQKSSVPEKTEEVLKEDITLSVSKKVIDHLNEKANTNFRAHTKQTLTLIEGRLNDHFTEEDIITVIDKKAREWIGTDMQKYLRPETLFGAKFEGYFNQCEPVKKHKKTESAHKYDMKEVEEKLFG